MEKSPGHVRVTGRIRAWLPPPKFVAMMRDGRDVAGSYIKRTGNWQNERNRWIEAARIIDRELKRSDVFLLRYEDLVENPEAALRELCQNLGLAYDPDMLLFHVKADDWVFGKKTKNELMTAHRKLRVRQMKTPIFDGRGKWKDTLPLEAAAEFETDELGKPMRRFGYLD